MDFELLRRAELIAFAGSPAKARRLILHGDWWRVTHGVYAPRGVPDGAEVRLAALALVVPPGAAISHRAALWAQGLDVLRDGIDVTRCAATACSSAGGFARTARRCPTTRSSSCPADCSSARRRGPSSTSPGASH